MSWRYRSQAQPAYSRMVLTTAGYRNLYVAVLNLMLQSWVTQANLYNHRKPYILFPFPAVVVTCLDHVTSLGCYYKLYNASEGNSEIFVVSLIGDLQSMTMQHIVWRAFLVLSGTIPKTVHFVRLNFICHVFSNCSRFPYGRLVDYLNSYWSYSDF